MNYLTVGLLMGASVAVLGSSENNELDPDWMRTEACAAFAYGLFAERTEIREGHALPRAVTMHSPKTIPRAIVVTKQRCADCEKLKEAIQREMAPPKGTWKIGEASSDDIQYIDCKKFELVEVRAKPKVVIVDSENKVLRSMEASEVSGRDGPQLIAKAINAARGVKMYRDEGAKQPIPVKASATVGQESGKISDPQEKDPPKERAKESSKQVPLSKPQYFYQYPSQQRFWNR